jgi:Fe2+ transport system protein FeoA
MSPLALLREGETAEIIDPAENGSLAHHHACRRHRHDKGSCRCAAPPAGHSCNHGCPGGGAAHSRLHLQDMGLRPGKKVEMITNRGTGPLILRIDECRIAMGRGAAMKIYVRRNAK